MKHSKTSVPFKSKLSFIIIALLSIIPVVLIVLDLDLLEELLIIFWILMFANFILIAVIIITGLTNNILVGKVYGHIFTNLYHIRLDSDKVLIESIIEFYKDSKNHIDFKRENLRLKEIVSSSSKVTSFPILSLSFTVLYAISIYEGNTDIYISNSTIIVVLNLVLVYTFIHVSAATYLKAKISLCNLCLNIIDEYDLDN